MDEYYRGVHEALARPEVGFVELLLWGFGIFIAILLVIFIGKFVKTVITQRVRHIHYYGIDFDSLKEMLETGLLSEEEYQRIRKRVAERLAEELTEEKKPGASRISMPAGKVPSAPKPGILQQTSIPGKGEPGDEQLPMASVAARPEPSKGKKPLDLEGMFRAGLLTAEEYEKLREFFRDKGI
jgi:uncharacterized membrane protein